MTQIAEVRPITTKSAPSPMLDWRELRRSLAYAIGLSLYFMIVYGGCNAITARRAGIGQAAFAWERHIPLVPAMIVPYMSIDLFFFAAPFLCGGARQRYDHARRVLLAITIAGACFLLFPLRTSFQRPPPLGGGLAPVFKFLYGFDQPYNLVPSLHMALRSLLWVVFAGATWGATRAALKVWFILIGLSTLLTHQHQVIDVVTGQLLGLFCLHVFPEDRPGASIPCASPTRHPRIASRYACGALAAMVAVYLLRPWGLLLMWPASSLSIVAVAYLGTGPAAFRKRDGHLPTSTYLLLGPYLLGSWLTLWFYQSRDAPFARLGPNLLIGRKLKDAEAQSLIRAAGVTAVLDMTAEHSETRRFQRCAGRIAYMNVPVLDLTPPTVDQLAAAVKFVCEHLARGGRVYIHCALGYSRIVCPAAALLLVTGQSSSVAEALAATRGVRPKAVIDPRHESVLREFVAANDIPLPSSGDL